MPRNGRPPSRTRLVERLDHAGDRVEPAPAIGKGADARQHDAVGARHRIRDRWSRRSAGRGRCRARALERFGGRMQIARAVIDDGDASPLRPGSGNRPMMSDDVRPRARQRWRRGRTRAAVRTRLADADPGIEEAPLRRLDIVADDDADVPPAAAAECQAAQRAGLDADQQRQQTARDGDDRVRRAEQAEANMHRHRPTTT